MIASGHSEEVCGQDPRRLALIFLLIGIALCAVGLLHIIFGLIFLWITAIIGVIIFVIGVPMLVIGAIIYRGQQKQACAEAQQTTPAVVGYDPANYGTQGQTQTKGHYPQGQSGPEGQPDIPPKQDYPMESDPPPSYDEVDKH